MSYNYLPLDRKTISFQQVKNLLDFRQHLSITFDAHESIERCRKYVDEKIANGDRLFYGINTGFGNMCNVRIDDDELEQLQKNLLMSHAAGMGDEVPAEIVKLMLAFKVKSLSYGYSGVQIETVKRLVDMFNEDVLPVVYELGSLGASGDLAPLSHLSLPLIGLGDVYYRGQKRASDDVLAELGWQPISLKSKEGLALINGTQFMTAYGLYCLKKAEKLLHWANSISALSYDGFDCSPDPLNDNIHRIRPHAGQRRVAAAMRNLLKGSELTSRPKKHVQDPYAFRCIPQVHGASFDVHSHVKDIFIQEINSVTDNPNVFAEEDLILSGGNFHGQPLALSLDYLSMAMAEISSISERRIYQLIAGLRELPVLLTSASGLHSGYMIAQYTAASIVSQNKQLAVPASTDSIPSSNNQEDHVSMGANAATKCFRLVNNVERILAIELATAARALHFRRPAKTSPVLEKLLDSFEQHLPFNDADHVVNDDLAKALEFIQQNEPLKY